MASPADIKLMCGYDDGGETNVDITGTGIDFITADNCTNTDGNRTTNPITIPDADFAYSYEKWLKFELGTTEPDTQCTNFQFWGAGTDPETDVVKDYYLIVQNWDTPALATTNAGYTNVAAATSGAKQAITGTLVTAEDQSYFLTMMLEVSTGASQGNMAQQTYNYSYDEN